MLQDIVIHKDPTMQMTKFGDLLEYAKQAFGDPTASQFDAFTYLDGRDI